MKLTLVKNDPEEGHMIEYLPPTGSVFFGNRTVGGEYNVTIDKVTPMV